MNKNQLLALVLFAALSLAPARAGSGGEPAPAPAAAPLKVGVTANFPPMIYKEGDKMAGVEADFAKTLGAELGRPVKFVEVDWEDQIQALADGKTDIIMSSMSVTMARQLRVNFATPYALVGQTVVVRRADANKYAMGFPMKPEGVIGVLTATTGDFLVQQEFPRNKRKDYTTPKDAASALVKKRIDLLICDSPTAWWIAGMNEIEGLTVVPVYLSREQLAWGVRKSDADLLKSVNEAIEKMQKDGRATAIIKRWIPLYQ
jgi:polar amino acid transport system substrate-binding protein